MISPCSRPGAVSLVIGILAVIFSVAEAAPCANDAGSGCGGLRVWPRKLLAPAMPPFDSAPMGPFDIEVGDEYDPSGDKDKDPMPNDEAAVPKPPPPSLYGASALASISQPDSPSSTITTTRPLETVVKAGAAFGPVPETDQPAAREERGLLRVVKKGATGSNKSHSG